MKGIFIFWLLVVTSAVGQVKVRGRVLDAATKEPLQDCYILVKGRITGTISGPDGNFELTVSLNSFVLQFNQIGYCSQAVKVNADRQLEIQLVRKVDLSAPFWRMERGDSALSKKKSADGTVYTYAVTNVPLNTSEVFYPSVSWNNGSYTILTPLDSLLRYLEVCSRNDPDDYSELRRPQPDRGEKPVLLTAKMLEKIGEDCITDFAIRMLRSRSLSVRNGKGAFVDTMTLSDIFWEGTCNNCCWGGYTFTAGEDTPILFSLTHTIC